MSWWTADPALTPLRVFDATAYSGLNLTDRSGNGQMLGVPSNTLNAAGSAAGGFYRAVIGTPVGGGLVAYSTPVATPTNGCFMAMVRVNTGDPTRGAILNRNASGGALITYNYDGSGKGNFATVAGAGRTVSGGGTPLAPAWNVVGVSWTPTHVQDFFNNTFFGAPTATVVSGTWAAMAVAPANTLPCDMAAHGFWSGVTTLAGMSAIANAMRAELTAADPGNIAVINTAPVVNLGTPPTPGVLAGANSTGHIRIDGTGKGVITGTTAIVGTPATKVATKVRLFDKRSAVLVAEVWSNAAGDYTFANLDPTRAYFVVGHDHTDTYNADVADNIFPGV